MAGYLGKTSITSGFTSLPLYRTAQTGDVLVMCFASGAAFTLSTPPANWTQLFYTSCGSSSPDYMMVGIVILTAGQTSVTFTTTASYSVTGLQFNGYVYRSGTAVSSTTATIPAVSGGSSTDIYVAFTERYSSGAPVALVNTGTVGSGSTDAFYLTNTASYSSWSYTGTTYLGGGALLLKPSDVTPPTCTSYTAANITKDGYDVYVYGVSDDISGVNKLQFPTWTLYNGQDDLDPSWQTSIKSAGTDQSGGTWLFHVNSTDHNNESGSYQTDIYAWDNAGNSVLLGSVYVTVPNPVPIAGSVSATTSLSLSSIFRSIWPVSCVSTSYLNASTSRSVKCSGSSTSLSLVLNSQSLSYKLPLSFPLSFYIKNITMLISSSSLCFSTSSMYTNAIQSIRLISTCSSNSSLSGIAKQSITSSGSCSAYSTLSGILKGNFNLSGTLSGTSSSSGWTTHIIAITAPTILAYSVFNATIRGSYLTAGSISASNSIGPSTILGNFRLISSVSAINSIGPSTILGNFSLHGSVSALGTVAPSTILGDFKLIGSISATNIINPIITVGIFSSTSICSASSSLTGSLRKNIYSSLFSTSSLSASIKGSFATSGTCIGGSSLSGGLKKNIYSTLISNSLLSSVAMGDFSVSSACSTTSSLFGSVLGNFRLVSFISATSIIAPSTILGSFSASSFISSTSTIGPSSILGDFKLISSIFATNTIGPAPILGAFKLVSSISAIGYINPITILGSISSSGACTGVTTLTANAIGYYALTGSCRSNTTVQSIIYKLLNGSSYTFSQVFLPGLQFPLDFPLLFTNDTPVTVSMQCSSSVSVTSSILGIISKALKVSLLMASSMTANITGAFSLSGTCATTSQIITSITGSFPLVGSINATGVITPTNIKGSFSINGIIAAVSTIGPPTITGSFSSTGSIIAISSISSPICRIISGAISSTSSLSATCTGLFSISGSLVGATSNISAVISRIIASTMSSNSVMSASMIGSFSLIGDISSYSTLSDSKLDVSVLVNPVTAASVLSPATILGTFRSTGSISATSNINAAILGTFDTSGACSGSSTLGSPIIGSFTTTGSLSASSTLSVNKAYKLMGGSMSTQSSIGIKTDKPLSFPLEFPLELYSYYVYITSTLAGSCSGTSSISATKLNKNLYSAISGSSTLLGGSLGQFNATGNLTTLSHASATIKGGFDVSGDITCNSSSGPVILLRGIYAWTTLTSISSASASITGSFSLEGDSSSYSNLVSSALLDISASLNPIVATSTMGPVITTGVFNTTGSVLSTSSMNANITGSFSTSSICSGLSGLGASILGSFNSVGNILAYSTMSSSSIYKLINGSIGAQSSIGIRNDKPLDFPLTFPLYLYSSYVYITSTLRGTCSGTSSISATRLNKNIFSTIPGNSLLVANVLGQFSTRSTITSLSSINGSILGNLSSGGFISANSSIQGNLSPVRWISGNAYSYSFIEITPMQLLEFPLDFPLIFSSISVTQDMQVDGYIPGLSYMSAGVSRVLFGNIVSGSQISANTKMSINARGVIPTLSTSSAYLSNFKGNIRGYLFTTSDMSGVINRHVKLLSNIGGVSRFQAFLSRQFSIYGHSITKSNLYISATIRSTTIKVQLKTTINNRVSIPYGVNIITHNSFIKKSPARIMVIYKPICAFIIHHGVRVVFVQQTGLRKYFSAVNRSNTPFSYRENITVKQCALGYNITKWAPNRLLVIKSNYLSCVKSKFIY